MISRSLLAILLGFSFTFCNTPTATQITAEQLSRGVAVDEQRVLILLVDLTSSNAIIRSANLVEGTFQPLKEQFHTDYLVRIRYLDQNNQILFQKFTDSPLAPAWLSQRNDGETSSRNYEQGSIMIRSQHLPGVRTIQIDYGKKRSWRNLAVLPLEIS